MKNVIFSYDTIQNGERGEAGYFLRERGIGFCWSCEHLRGRGYVENSIKSVKVEEA